jgi:hypothetical protein
MRSLLVSAVVACAVTALTQTTTGPIRKAPPPHDHVSISLAGGPRALAPGPITLYDNNNIPSGYYYPPSGSIVPADDLHMIGGGLINGFTIGYYDPPGGGDLTDAVVAFYENDPFDGSIAGPIAAFTISGLPKPGSYMVTIDLTGGYEFVAPANLWMSLEFPGSNDAGWLIYGPPAVGSSHDLFLDVNSLKLYNFGGSPKADFCIAIYAAWIQPDALPVDLGGTYCSGSREGDQDGEVLATTRPGGSLIYLEKVYERSGAVVAQDGTYSPFSDSKKPPRDLVVNMRERSFQFDADLGSNSTWDAEVFMAGLGSHLYGLDGTPAVWAAMYESGGVYRVELQTTFGSGGPAYAAAADETAFRVVCQVNAANTEMTATVTPLNGANAGTPTAVGPLTLDPVSDDVSAIPFFAGFDGPNSKSRAEVALSNFNTTAGDNALYAFADDPYVQTTDTIVYRLAMTNLAQPVLGFQAFLSSAGVQAFDSGYYTFYPFPEWIIDPIAAELDLAAGVDFEGGQGAVDVNATLAYVYFGPTGEGAAELLVDVDNGGSPPIPARFSDEHGGAVVPFRVASNVVVADDTPPGVPSFTAEQNGASIIGGTAIQGDLKVCVQAYDDDALTLGSGIQCRPQIAIDFAPLGAGPEDVTLGTYSGVGNEFCGEYTIVPSTPCGPATIYVTVTDNSGNQTTTSGSFTVNAARAVVEVVLAGVQLPVGTPLVRGIEIVLGGGGGSNAPHVVCVDMTFTDADGVGGSPAAGTVVLDLIPCGEGPALSLVSAKDVKHTLRDLEPLTHTGDNQYTGALTLKGGDATDDNVIDILDFGAFAYKYGQTMSPDTPCGTSGLHPDFSANGLVDTADYTFIQTQFLTLGEEEPGYYGPIAPPRERVQVWEMVAAGIPIAASFDLNRDGWITVEEIAEWLEGGGQPGTGSGPSAGR